MSLKIYSQTIILIFSVGFITRYVYKYYTSNRNPKQRKEVNEVIMFSSDKSILRKSKYSKCLINESMGRLLHYLHSPKYSLDICMYSFTNVDLTYALIKLHHRGVQIRLIIDADMAFTSGSRLRQLENLGVHIRWMKSTNLMHHKFCIVDGASEGMTATPLVIAGSLNWTNQALCGNWEDVIVTSQKELVEQYKNEYARLWMQFKPIVT